MQLETCDWKGAGELQDRVREETRVTRVRGRRCLLEVEVDLRGE